jgi:hypothetical protein
MAWAYDFDPDRSPRRSRRYPAPASSSTARRKPMTPR